MIGLFKQLRVRLSVSTGLFKTSLCDPLEDLCVLSGKKINPLTLPIGKQAQRIAKFALRYTKGSII